MSAPIDRKPGDSVEPPQATAPGGPEQPPEAHKAEPPAIRRAGSRPTRPPQRSFGRRAAPVVSALLLLAAAALIWSLNRPDSEVLFPDQPHAYTYAEAKSAEGVSLHMMRVSPEDVELRTAGTALKETGAYGINGGFFYGPSLLSIAIMNDRPVGGAERSAGSGWYNAKYARGTLVWDGAARRLSVQTVSSGDELAVQDRARYWAQGGVSMNLADEASWAAAAAAQHLPFADEPRLRSGLVYNADGELWLIVSSSKCTGDLFRRAVLEAVPGEGREGIFLDGDGSSQMNADEALLTGDGRPVMQMIAVQPAIAREAE